MDLTRVFRIDPTGTPAEEKRGEREKKKGSYQNEEKRRTWQRPA